ncbi:MAG: class I tRNA ligase family protein, partial [Candidatus Omnitrophica bacterium]|nr:class I tRNA ligase family protein [Candidatus Omnitrophota bacterium]
EPDQTKKSPMDFALWKTSKPEEPSWDSPWGKGRPGWHIECSAMSMKYLGENFDIHAGGLDLIFPHHENEIAQSEAASGRAFANYWLHNGMLTVGGEKMSKSLNNFITMQDLLKEYNPEEIKLFILTVHYQSPLDFTKDRLAAAGKALNRFYNLFDKIDELIKYYEDEPASPSEAESLGKEIAARLEDYKLILEKFDQQINKCRLDFETAMDDNFNTARALAGFFDLQSAASTFFYNEDVPGNKKTSLLRKARFTFKELGDVLGLFREGVRPEQTTADDPVLTDNVKKLLEDVVSKLKEEDKFEPVSGSMVENLPESPDEELSLPGTFLPEKIKDLSLDNALEWLDYLSSKLRPQEVDILLDGLLKVFIELRTRLRSKKDFKSADEIRDNLSQLGLVLKDGRDGQTTWSRS